MDGEWITLELGEDVRCEVFVPCIPGTPKERLTSIAWGILKNKIPGKKKGMFAVSEALQTISDFQYAHGFGSKFEAEKELGLQEKK